MESLRVNVFHTGLEMRMPELVFAAEKSVREVKENLYRRTGTAPETMELWLVDGVGRRRQLLNEDETRLSDVMPPEAQESGWELHIVDTDENGMTREALEADVPKYEAPHGRKDFAQFRRVKRSSGEGAQPVPDATTGMKEAAEFDDDDRVVTLKDGLKGTVRYIGKCATAAPGFFVGVELDEPKGRNDGTVKGKRLFECKAGHGILVRPFALRKMQHSDLGDDREEL